MKVRQFLLTLAAGTIFSGAFDCGAAPAGPPKKILFFSKSSAFEHDVISYKQGQPSDVEEVLTELGAKNHWEFTFSKDGSLFTPQYLAPFDALFFYTSGDLCSAGNDKNPPMTPEGKAALLDYVKGGKGFIGTHSASDTFHTNNEALKGPDRYRNFGEAADPYVKMLGGEFIKHGKQQKAKMRCVDPKFPGMEKYAAGFDLHEEWYSLKDFRDDLNVILVQESDSMKGPEYQRPAYPATWARMHGQGRVFYTSMGHRDDVWTNPIFQDILTGGIAWAVGEAKAELRRNLSEVAPGWAQNPPFIIPKPPAAPATP